VLVVIGMMAAVWDRDCIGNAAVAVAVAFGNKNLHSAVPIAAGLELESQSVG